MPDGRPLYGILWGHILFGTYGGWGWSELLSKGDVMGGEGSIEHSKLAQGRSSSLTVRSSLLTISLCCSWTMVFFLMVDMRFGSFWLTAGNRFGLFYLRFPPSGNWVWSLLLTLPPQQVKKMNGK